MNIQLLKVYKGMPYEEYEKLEGIRTHELILLSQSPFHYARRDQISFASADLGVSAHAKLLEDKKDYKIKENFSIDGESLNLRLKAHREYVEENQIKFLSQEEHSMIQRWNKQFMFIKGEEFESEISIQYTINGVLCKSRLDYMDSRGVGDVKTVAGEWSVRNHLHYIRNLNYDVQGYICLILANKLKDNNYIYFDYFFCYKNSPYATQRIRVSLEKLEETALHKIEKAISNFQAMELGILGDHDGLEEIVYE